MSSSGGEESDNCKFEEEDGLEDEDQATTGLLGTQMTGSSLIGYGSVFYREVVPNTWITKSWKDVVVNTGAAQGTLQDIKRTEACGGYAYANNHDIITRNRFVYWRVNHDTLELSEESLDVNLVSGNVCIRFQDTPVLDGVSVHEQDDVNVIVLVATVSSVHRIVLPHPRRLAPKGNEFKLDDSGIVRHSLPSIFADLTAVLLRDPSSYHVLNLSSASASPASHTSVCWLSASGEAHFALASQSGSILHVRLPSLRRQVDQPTPGVTVIELRKSNVIRRVLAGVVPSVLRGGVSSQAQDAPLSLCFDASTGTQLLFALCRDCRVRVWSIYDQQCVFECDILPFVAHNNDQHLQSVNNGGRLPLTGQRHVLKKCLSLGEEDFKVILVAALHYGERRNFILLHLSKSFDGYQLDHLATLIGQTHNLIDFTLTSSRLWALWSTSHSETVLSYTSFVTHELSTSKKTSNWKEAILDSPESRQFHLPEDLVDPREEYCEHIFYPGRFSVNTISKAIINTFRRSTDMSHASDFDASSITRLRKEVIVAVETELQNCASEYELADDVYVQLQQECWAKFYSGCLQFHQVEMEPMGLFVDVNTDLVYFIKKSCLSVLRPCDFIEMFSTRCIDGFNAVNQPLEISSNPLFSRSSIADDLEILLQCLTQLRSKYTLELIHDFKYDMYHLVNPDLIAHTIVDTMFNVENVAIEIHQFIRRIKHFDVVFESLLDLLDLTSSVASKLSLPSDLAMDLNDIETEGDFNGKALLAWTQRNLFASCIGASLLADSVHQMAEARFEMCRDLLVLIVILNRTTEAAVGLSVNTVERLRSHLLPRTCLLTHAYFTVTWICQTVASAFQLDTVLDENMRHLGLLNLSDVGEQQCRPSSYFDSGSLRLIELFVRNEGGSLARSHLSRFNIGGFDRSWTNAFEHLVTLLLEQVWPISVNYLFLDVLITNHQYVQIQEYDRLLRPWCEWNSYSRIFARGYSHLVQGKPSAAVDAFQTAANGVIDEEFIIYKLGLNKVDSLQQQQQQLVVLFYRKCIHLLEEFQYAEHAIMMAKKVIPLVENKDNGHLATLWALLFKYFMELGRNEDALVAMLSNPDHSRKLTCLRQFVVVLFERRQLKALIEFSYKDLEDEVVKIMEQRARTIDLNVHNYYELLYSFHTVRGNFRRAGSMMYEYGMRLGSEVGGLRGLQKQAKCYLAAMNTLSIIDPNYAWLVKPLQMINAPPSMMQITHPDASPKRSYDGDELPAVTSGLKHQVALVELKDIRLEYELVLARLQLIKKDDDPVMAHGVGHSAEETVIHLSKAGLFDKAIRICKSFSLPLQPVIETLVSKCVHLTRALSSDPLSAATAWNWLADNEIPGRQPAHDDNVCDYAWILLKSYLDEHEEKGQTVLHKCAALRLLCLGCRPPNWLLATYKLRDVADLLRVYLRFGLLEDAACLTLEYIDAVLGHGNEYFGLKSGLQDNRAKPVWMPYTSIDKLVETLDSINPSNLTLASLNDSLKNKLMKYHREVEIASKRMVTQIQIIN